MSATPEATATGQGQHARLLLVTADRGKADALRTRLVRTGYAVAWAADMALALAAMQAQRPDLALLVDFDKEAPGGETPSFREAPGGETLSFRVEALKAAADGTYLPVLLLTTETAGTEREWALSGADDLLPADTSDALLRLRLEVLLHLKWRYQAMSDSILEMEATCKAAQQAAARYEAIFQQNMQAMLIVGDNGMIAEANACASALIGCEPETLSGLPLAALCPPELPWASELAKQGPFRPFSDPEASLMTLSRAVVPVTVSSAPVDPAPVPQYVVTLTDRRPELSRLKDAQRAAAQETAAVFSREINNPLFVVSSNIEMLQNALSHEESGIQAKLERIADAGQRIVRAAARASAPPAPAED